MEPPAAEEEAAEEEEQVDRTLMTDMILNENKVPVGSAMSAVRTSRSRPGSALPKSHRETYNHDFEAESPEGLIGMDLEENVSAALEMVSSQLGRSGVARDEAAMLAQLRSELQHNVAVRGEQEAEDPAARGLSVPGSPLAWCPEEERVDHASMSCIDFDDLGQARPEELRSAQSIEKEDRLVDSLRGEFQRHIASRMEEAEDDDDECPGAARESLAPPPPVEEGEAEARPKEEEEAGSSPQVLAALGFFSEPGEHEMRPFIEDLEVRIRAREAVSKGMMTGSPPPTSSTTEAPGGTSEPGSAILRDSSTVTSTVMDRFRVPLGPSLADPGYKVSLARWQAEIQARSEAVMDSIMAQVDQDMSIYSN